MREIKFRAWDIQAQRMRYLEDAEFIIEYCGVTTIEAITGEIQPRNWPLMQYTGLKDKNGKEIYEGDIIEYEDRNENLRREEVVFNEGTFSAGVQWDDGEFDHYSIENLYYSVIEVIGNIYETPSC